MESYAISNDFIKIFKTGKLDCATITPCLRLLNVRSLMSNFDVFVNIIQTEVFDIIVIAETWLSSEMCSEAV